MTVAADLTTIGTGLFSKLSTASGTALWGSGAAARFYTLQAPAEVLQANEDYGLYFHVAGGDENVNPAGSFDVDYQVEFWSGASLARARQGQTYIRQALHYQTLTFADTTNFWTVQKGLIETVETVEGRQFWRCGGVYQIRGA